MLLSVSAHPASRLRHQDTSLLQMSYESATAAALPYVHLDWALWNRVSKNNPDRNDLQEPTVRQSSKSSHWDKLGNRLLSEGP